MLTQIDSALTPRDAPPCWLELRAEQEALSLVRFYSTPTIAKDELLARI